MYLILKREMLPESDWEVLDKAPLVVRLVCIFRFGNKIIYKILASL